MGRKKKNKQSQKQSQKLKSLYPYSWLPEDFKPGSLGFHEAVDRTCLIAELFSYQVASHPAVEVHPKLKKLSDKIENQLFELYQKLSLVHAFERGHGSSSDAGLKNPVFGVPVPTEEEKQRERAKAVVFAETKEFEANTRYGGSSADPDRKMTQEDYNRIFPDCKIVKVTGIDESRSQDGSWVEFRENV